MEVGRVPGRWGCRISFSFTALSCWWKFSSFTVTALTLTLPNVEKHCQDFVFIFGGVRFQKMTCRWWWWWNMHWKYSTTCDDDWIGGYLSISSPISSNVVYRFIVQVSIENTYRGIVFVLIVNGWLLARPIILWKPLMNNLILRKIPISFSPTIPTSSIALQR